MFNFATGMAYVSSWTVPTPITICHWVIPRVFNATANRFFGTADDFETKCIPPSGNIYQGDIFESAGVQATTTAVIGTRVHLAFTSSINGTTLTYVNGVQESTSSNGALPSSPASLAVGGRYGASSGQEANSDLEDIRIYNRILSAAEIKNIYASNGRDCIIGGLINQWAVSTKGDGTDIGTDYIYDLTSSRQHLQKLSNNIYYRGGFLNPRRRV